MPAIALAALACSEARSDVWLPALFSDSMVLQRDAPLVVWGWADPGEQVRIDFRGSRASAKADHKGRWSTSLGPFAAGGPYEMVIRGKNRMILRDILVGDVWLASGQSNMECSLQCPWGAASNADREIAQADFPNIRLFVVKHDAAPKPKADVD